MKKLACTAFLMICFSVIFAQKGFPKFGKIDKSDLEMKECDFDKDAQAYKLFDYGSVEYIVGGDQFNIQTERRTRIKILSEKGLDEANIKINFYSLNHYEKIYDISGVTYNLDNSGKITTTKLEKSSVFIKELNNRYSQVSFSMPDVKVGSVIEFKYKDTKKSLSNLDDWNFQDDIPTRVSLYQIKIPSIFRFATQLLAYQHVAQTSENIHDVLTYHLGVISDRSELKTYQMNNVPAIRDEPFMGAEKDYLQRVIFQLNSIVYADGQVDEVMSNWKKITQTLLEDEDFGTQLKKNLPHTSALDDSLKNVKDDYQKMLLIHDYVRRNMNWNGIESIYADKGIKSAWDKKSGNNTELNLILIDLLREAGLDAYPLLVSTKDNGAVNTIYPFLEQFNNTMTCVFIGNDRYILNAADKYNPANLSPYDVLDNQAFIVDKDRGGWIVLSDKKDVWQNMVSIFASITPDALMEGNATVYSYGYSKNPRLKEWKEDKKSFKENFTKSLTAMKIKNLEVKNGEVDSLPLEQKLDFSLPLNSSGDYKYFTLNLFQGLEKNPFIADKRTTDIEFNYPKSYIIVGKISIPDGFEIEGLPKNIKMIMPDTSITMQRFIQKGTNSIDFRISLDFKRSYYTAGNYPIFHEFYKQLFNMLNEQIVIKKKLDS
jgi:hypothetical protein